MKCSTLVFLLKTTPKNLDPGKRCCGECTLNILSQRERVSLCQPYCERLSRLAGFSIISQLVQVGTLASKLVLRRGAGSDRVSSVRCGLSGFVYWPGASKDASVPMIT